MNDICIDCGDAKPNADWHLRRCPPCHEIWMRHSQRLRGQSETYCGLDPVLTGENDPFYKSGACTNHDDDFVRWKRGEKVRGGLVGVSYRWTRDVLKTAAISAWGILGAPFYLVGGLIGGGIRWRQVAPEIKEDPPGGETF